MNELLPFESYLEQEFMKFPLTVMTKRKNTSPELEGKKNLTVLEGRVGRSEGGSYTDVGTKQCRDPKAGVSRCLPGNL